MLTKQLNSSSEFTHISSTMAKTVEFLKNMNNNLHKKLSLAMQAIEDILTDDDIEYSRQHHPQLINTLYDRWDNIDRVFLDEFANLSTDDGWNNFVTRAINPFKEVVFKIRRVKR